MHYILGPSIVAVMSYVKVADLVTHNYSHYDNPQATIIKFDHTHLSGTHSPLPGSGRRGEFLCGRGCGCGQEQCGSEAEPACLWQSQLEDLLISRTSAPVYISTCACVHER